MVSKEKESLELLRLSKIPHDQLVDIPSKKDQKYKFNKRIACNTEIVFNNIVVNDITSSKLTYENTS